MKEAMKRMKIKRFFLATFVERLSKA